MHQGFLEFFDILLKISCISETTGIIAVLLCLYYLWCVTAGLAQSVEGLTAAELEVAGLIPRAGPYALLTEK